MSNLIDTNKPIDVNSSFVVEKRQLGKQLKKIIIKNPKIILGLLGFATVLLAVGLTVFQTKTSQEVRSDASGGIPTPDVKLVVSSDISRSHDEDPSRTGLQLSKDKTGLIDIKLDPKSLPVVGVELFVQYNGAKITLENMTANQSQFAQFAQITDLGNNQIRLLALLQPDQSPITNMVNLGNLQVSIKEPLQASNLVLLRANFIVDQEQTLRSVTGLASDNPIAKGHAVTIEPKTTAVANTPTPTATPTPDSHPHPTNTPTPTPNPESVSDIPNVSISGDIDLTQTRLDSDGNLKIGYKVTQASPRPSTQNGWQINVVAVPSNQTVSPLDSEKRIRSASCTNARIGYSCTIEIRSADLTGKDKVFLFANQFKQYGTQGYSYYCNWKNHGSWTVAGGDQGTAGSAPLPSSHCSNTTLKKYLLEVPTLTPDKRVTATPVPSPVDI